MCYYPENKSKIALSLSLTGIEHFHAELPKTNICCVTRRLSVGIIQARCSCCLLYDNFRTICRSLWLFACFDRKVSAFFFSITTCKSTSLSIECRRRLIAWLVKFINNEPAVCWPVGFLQISLDEKIPGHSQLFSWAKTIDMKERETQRPQFFFFFSLRDHSFLRLRYYEGEFRPLFMFRKKVSCKQFIFKLKLSYQNKTYIASKKPNVPLHLKPFPV